MREFGLDNEISRVRYLADELFEKVLYDEDPVFVSDEATLWDVSMSDVSDVLQRVRTHYGVPLTLEETQQLPLWKLLLLLDKRRRTGKSGTA